MFAETAQHTSQFLQHHRHWGALFVFLIALSESLPIIGTIIPGSVTMTAVGVLIGTAIFPGASTLLLATIGAFVGDSIGFLLGYHFQSRIHTLWPFNKYPKWLKVGETFFKKHGGISIILGRFIGPARSTVPMVAGLLKMSPPRFVLAALPSALLWAILYITPGVLLGALSLELPPTQAAEFILVGVLVVVLLWFLFWLLQFFFRRVCRSIYQTISNAWRKLNVSHSKNIVVKYIRRPDAILDAKQLALLIGGMICLVLFVLVAASALSKGWITALNKPVFHFLQSIRTPAISTAFILITNCGKPICIIMASILLCLYCFVKKEWWLIKYILLALFSSSLIVMAFKHVFYSARPTGFIDNLTSSSFPSGHSALSIVVYGFITYLLSHTVEKQFRWLINSLGFLWITAIIFSRIYLGAHWLSDVIASTCLGLGLLQWIVLLYRRHHGFESIPKHFLWATLITFLMAWGSYNGLRYHQTKQHFIPNLPQHSITMADWWQRPASSLPIYRNNRFGQATQPFNLQWAGDLTKIKHQLSMMGWKPVDTKRNIQNNLQRLISYRPLHHMPLLTQQYRLQAPVLIMTYHLPQTQRIAELRLWKSGWHFSNTPCSLWIGTVSLHIPPHKLLVLNNQPLVIFTNGAGLQQLVQHLTAYQSQQLKVPTDRLPAAVAELKWNGQILALRPKP